MGSSESHDGSVQSVVTSGFVRPSSHSWALVPAAALAAGCGSNTTASAAPKPEPPAIATVAVESRPIDRYLRVTGSLVADEQAEVGAETTGRVVATPWNAEPGSRKARSSSVCRRPRRRRSCRRRKPTPGNSRRGWARRGTAVRSDAGARRDEREGVARVAEAEFGRINRSSSRKSCRRASIDQRGRRSKSPASSSRWR